MQLFRLKNSTGKGNFFLGWWRSNKVTDGAGNLKLVHKSINSELSPYIVPIRILYWLHSKLFVSPVHLVYDNNLNLFILKPCHPLQRAICILFLVLTSLSILNNIKEAGKSLLNDTGYIVAYFDFINFFVVTGFIYIHMYIHWFRLHQLNKWVYILQKSSLVQFSNLSMWKAKLFGSFIALLSLYLTVVWMLTLLGLDFNRFLLLYETSESVARQLFFLKENANVGLILRVLAITAKLYDAIYVHIPFNAFIPIQQFCCFHLVADFFSAVKQLSISPQNMPKFYSDYNLMLEAINAFFGPYSFLIIFTALSFHSVHLLDVLNTPWTNWTWKVNMYIYVCFLLSWFTFPTKIFMMSRGLRRWLWKEQNGVSIPVEQLKLIIYDLNCGILGLGGWRFFKFSPSVTGNTLQLLLTYCLLNLQHTK